MAKNKRPPQPQGDFGKFDRNKVTVDVAEEDESDGTEPTDVAAPSQEELDALMQDGGDQATETNAAQAVTINAPSPLLDPIKAGITGKEAPLGAYQKLSEEAARATTVKDQEAIIAAAHPRVNWEDPAIHYKRALTSGRGLPDFRVRADAPPLLVKAKDTFERIVAGGLLLPGATSCYNEVVDLLLAIKSDIEEKTDAVSGAGSADGQPSLGG